MHIVLDGRFLQDHFPGIARYTYDLALALGRQADRPVTVIVDPTMRNTHYDIDFLARAPGITLRPIPAPIFRVSGFLRMAHALSLLHADVYHVPYYLKSPWTPCPCVSSIFDIISGHYSRFLPGLKARIAYKSAMLLAVRTSAKIIVPSRATRDDLVDLYRADSRSVATVPLGVSAHFSPSTPALIQQLRERYSLPSRFVLHVGINKPHKNLSRLIEAFSVAELPTEIGLVLAGPRDRRYPTGRELAGCLGIQDRVIELEAVPTNDLPSLYSAASVFAFPSIYEGFGLPVIEAMACGTPVVCSNTGSLPEVVGNAAIIVDPFDVSDLAQGLKAMLDGGNDRAVFSLTGIERASDYSWDATAEATWRVYREALVSC